MISNVIILSKIHGINHYKIVFENGSIHFLNDTCNTSNIYKMYKEWLAEGNEPLPADEPEQPEEPNA